MATLFVPEGNDVCGLEPCWQAVSAVCQPRVVAFSCSVPATTYGAGYGVPGAAERAGGGLGAPRGGSRGRGTLRLRKQAFPLVRGFTVAPRCHRHDRAAAIHD